MVPIVQEERLLTDAEQAGDQGEHGQLVPVARAHVQRLAVQHFNKVFQAGHVDFVLESDYNNSIYGAFTDPRRA